MTSGIEDDGGDNDDDAGDDKNRIKLYLSKIVYGFGELSLHTHTDRYRMHTKCTVRQRNCASTRLRLGGKHAGESSYNNRLP